MGVSGGRREGEGVCAAAFLSREVGLDSDAAEKEAGLEGRRCTRVAPSGGVRTRRHVPFDTLHCGMRASKRRLLVQRAWATRLVEGNKKVGLFSLRVAGCSVLFF